MQSTEWSLRLVIRDAGPLGYLRGIKSATQRIVPHLLTFQPLAHRADGQVAPGVPRYRSSEGGHWQGNESQHEDVGSGLQLQRNVNVQNVLRKVVGSGGART